MLATPTEAADWLQTELADGDLAIRAVGDCVAPRRAYQAIYEGRRLGLEL